MSEQRTVRCDECGRIRTEHNRWFKLSVSPASFTLWSAAGCPPAADVLDLCSPFCARAWLSRWADALMLGGAA